MFTNTQLLATPNGFLGNLITGTRGFRKHVFLAGLLSLLVAVLMIPKVSEAAEFDIEIFAPIGPTAMFDATAIGDSLIAGTRESESWRSNDQGFSWLCEGSIYEGFRPVAIDGQKVFGNEIGGGTPVVEENGACQSVEFNFPRPPDPDFPPYFYNGRLVDADSGRFLVMATSARTGEVTYFVEEDGILNELDLSAVGQNFGPVALDQDLLILNTGTPGEISTYDYKQGLVNRLNCDGFERIVAEGASNGKIVGWGNPVGAVEYTELGFLHDGISCSSIEFLGRRVKARDVYENKIVGSLETEALDTQAFIATIKYTEPDISFSIANGSSQECSQVGGREVTATADYFVLPEDPLNQISWTLNGEVVGFGESLSLFAPLGISTLLATLETQSGATSEANGQIEIVDTQAPTVSFEFIDRSGLPVDNISAEQLYGKRRARLVADIRSSDACDGEVAIDTMVGTSLIDQQVIRVKVANGKVSLNSEQLDVTVRATDDSGNSATLEKQYSIVP